MDVEIVTDNMPAGHMGIGGHHCLDMGQEICFFPRRAAKRGQQLSRDHVTTENETARSMTLILEFASLHMARRER